MLASIADELLVQDLPQEVKSAILRVLPSEEETDNLLIEEYQRGFKDGQKESEELVNHEMIVDLREMLRERINNSTELEDILDKLKQIEEQYT